MSFENSLNDNEKNDIQLHGIGLSSNVVSSSLDDEEEEFFSEVFSKENNENKKENSKINQKNKRDSIRYSSILKKFTQNQKSEDSETEISDITNEWEHVCLEISTLVKDMIPNVEVPVETNKQQEFILTIVKELTGRIKNQNESKDYIKLKEKNAKLKEQISKMQDKYDSLLKEIDNQRIEQKKQIINEKSEEDKKISENIQQIKELVKLQQKSQRKLIKDMKSSNSRMSSKSFSKKVDEKTKVTKTKRIPFPESDSTDSSDSSSEVYIVRTKPSKHEKVVKVQKQQKKNIKTKEAEESYSYSPDYSSITSESSSKAGYTSKHRHDSHIKHKINDLIEITNEIQDEYSKIDPNLSISKLSLLHDSLLQEEKKLKK